MKTAHNIEDQLGWLALTLTPRLGPRRILDMVKRLGPPSRIFEASLQNSRPCSLPRRPRSFYSTARRAGLLNQSGPRFKPSVRTLFLTTASTIRSGFARSTTHRQFCGHAARPHSCPVTRLLWWAPGIQLRMVREWPSFYRAISRHGICWGSAEWPAASTLACTEAHLQRACRRSPFGVLESMFPIRRRMEALGRDSGHWWRNRQRIALRDICCPTEFPAPESHPQWHQHRRAGGRGW